MAWRWSSSREALEAVADKAIERNIGARGLRAVMEGMLTKVMYDIPSDPTITKVTITADCVNGAEPMVERDPEKVTRKAKPEDRRCGKTDRTGLLTDRTKRRGDTLRPPFRCR